MRLNVRAGDRAGERVEEYVGEALSILTTEEKPKLTSIQIPRGLLGFVPLPTAGCQRVCRVYTTSAALATPCTQRFSRVPLLAGMIQLWARQDNTANADTNIPLICVRNPEECVGDANTC